MNKKVISPKQTEIENTEVENKYLKKMLKNLVITKEQLKTDAPTIIEKEGYCNVVLALVDVNRYYTKENTYLPEWQVVNTYFYNKHKDDYLGYVDLEMILPPKELR